MNEENKRPKSTTSRKRERAPRKTPRKTLRKPNKVPTGEVPKKESVTGSEVCDTILDAAVAAAKSLADSESLRDNPVVRTVRKVFEDEEA